MALAYRTAGDGNGGVPVLLIHGGAEDAEMLAAQAQAIAGHGRRVIWYDRRGTGASTREQWPGSGADQHADDAADLLTSLSAAPAQVLGFSSGGIVALALAARHSELVTEVIAWEAPVVTALPGGPDTHARIMAPVEAHLNANPADWVGAYLITLEVISNGQADLDSPEVKRSSVNAEAMVRDDGPLITRREFAAGELPAEKVTIAISESPDPMHEAIGERLAALVGTACVRVPGADDHEIYLTRPDVIAGWIGAR
jgi:pimeloyl-ACP methyl ester carboxylesterase